jgi:hypothetical protein
MSHAQNARGVNGSEPRNWQVELQLLIAKAKAFEAHARPILEGVPDITGDEPDGAFDGAPEWLCDLYDDVHAQRLRREAGDAAMSETIAFDLFGNLF